MRKKYIKPDIETFRVKLSEILIVGSGQNDININTPITDPTGVAAREGNCFDSLFDDFN